MEQAGQLRPGQPAQRDAARAQALVELGAAGGQLARGLVGREGWAGPGGAEPAGQEGWGGGRVGRGRDGQGEVDAALQQAVVARQRSEEGAMIGAQPAQPIVGLAGGGAGVGGDGRLDVERAERDEDLERPGERRQRQAQRLDEAVGLGRGAQRERRRVGGQHGDERAVGASQVVAGDGGQVEQAVGRGGRAVRSKRQACGERHAGFLSLRVGWAASVGRGRGRGRGGAGRPPGERERRLGPGRRRPVRRRGPRRSPDEPPGSGGVVEQVQQPEVGRALADGDEGGEQRRPPARRRPGR